MRKQQLIFLLFAVFVQFASAQQYKFNTYNKLNGLAQDFVYDIRQDLNGYLWVSTGEGISRFDGQHFVNYNSVNGLAENVTTCSYVARSGKIYYGHNEGGISVWESGKFKLYDQSEISTSTVKGIATLDDNIIYVTQNDGLYLIDDEQHTRKIFQHKNITFNNLLVKNDSVIYVGTSDGLYVFINKNGTPESFRHEFSGKNISAVTDVKNEEYIIIAITGEGIARVRIHNGKLESGLWESKTSFTLKQINAILIDKNQDLWIGTFGSGVIKFSHNYITGNEEFTVYNSENGLGADYIQSIYEDHEGNIWIGTFGKGMATLMDDFFVFYSHSQNEFGNSISAVYINEKYSYFGVENGLIIIHPGVEKGFTFYGINNAGIKSPVTAICEVGSDIWIGTESDGIFVLKNGIETPVVIKGNYNSLEKSVNDLLFNNDIVFAATYGGLLLIDPDDGEKTVIGTENGMPHNVIYSLSRDQQGDVLIGTKSNAIYKIHQDEISEIGVVESGLLNFVDIITDKKNNIWAATLENGVFKISSDTIINYNLLDGLKSNYCYAIGIDSYQQIWVGHSAGLSKIKEEQISLYGQEYGILYQVNPRCIVLDEKAHLWIGTGNGAIRYDATKDVINQTPPLVNLVSITIGDKAIDLKKEIDLSYGAYRIKFDFIGISFSDPQHVSYKYKLEGFDQDYSELSTVNSANYGKITDGKYVLKVIACNADGVCGEPIELVVINIATPFWKMWWFIVLCAIFLLIVVFGILKWRLHNMQKVQDYLAYQLKIKTSEVVEQKEKIEAINKDLTSSINYAERIQRSMLPNVELLTRMLPGSFVYYQPRDIVSGDFFFLKKAGHKLIVVTADCTGHGVPGAFMSFIGGITLRNIYRGQFADDIVSPLKAMQLLDVEIETILKQKSVLDAEDDFYRTRDGMDLTICEIDTKEKSVQICSAMRPFLIERNGEYELHSGDRYSIGGGLEEVKKNFTLRNFDLQSGDSIYLFSDGITDQFGGPAHRKLKISGLTEMLKQCGNLSGEPKAGFIRDAVAKWKGDTLQIDDILLLGIRL